MKKTFLFSALALLAMSATILFASCGSDDDTPGGGNGNNNGNPKTYNLFYVIAVSKNYQQYSTFTANVYNAYSGKEVSINVDEWGGSYGNIYGQQPIIDNFVDTYLNTGLVDLSKYKICYYLVGNIKKGDRIEASYKWTLNQEKFNSINSVSMPVAVPTSTYMVLDENYALVAAKNARWSASSIAKDRIPDYIQKYSTGQYSETFDF